MLKNKKNVHTMKYVNEGLAINNEASKNNDILVVGGGLAGTEIAAELATRTSKKITLIHSKDRMIERNPEKASNYAYHFLRSKGVDIKFNERVTEHMEGYFKTNQGNKYFYKMAIWCAGISFDIPFLDKTDFPHCKDKEGHILDNNYLLVNPHKYIFAGGDVANTKEEKTAQNADRHAKTIANNIICLDKGKDMKKYKPRTGPLVISLGPWKGLLVAGNFVFSGLMPGIMKHLIEMAVIFRLKNL
jgi:NADH dehydrogenase FAD-containing subunit